MWQQVVVSLQTLLERALVLGGRSALEMHGYGHYLPQSAAEVHLYGPTAPPSWTKTLALDEQFIYHNSSRIFENDLAGWVPPELEPAVEERGHTQTDQLRRAAVTVLPWDQGRWPLVVSTPERAVLELLDNVPGHESFHQADVLVEGLATLSPRRLQQVLVSCRSIKVKRLFMFFAERHGHAWFGQLDRSAVGLGSGKRMLAPGGRLDSTYQITVPEELYGFQ